MIQCKPGRPYVLHGEVIYGVGAMGDGSICLRCGYETYARIWPRESIRKVKAPEDWPAINEAREKDIQNK